MEILDLSVVKVQGIHRNAEQTRTAVDFNISIYNLQFMRLILIGFKKDLVPRH